MCAGCAQPIFTLRAAVVGPDFALRAPNGLEIRTGAREQISTWFLAENKGKNSYVWCQKAAVCSLLYPRCPFHPSFEIIWKSGFQLDFGGSRRKQISTYFLVEKLVQKSWNRWPKSPIWYMLSAVAPAHLNFGIGTSTPPLQCHNHCVGSKTIQTLKSCM